MVRYLAATGIAIVALVFGTLAPDTNAHPWGGLVVDASGSIYFTFVCPMTGDSHRACVWRLNAGESEPTPVLESTSDPSDMILIRTADRTVYVAERMGPGPFTTRLWKLLPGPEPELIIPYSPPGGFNPSPFTVDNSGVVYFKHDGRLLRAATGGATQPEESLYQDAIGNDNVVAAIGNMSIVEDGKLYMQYDGKLASTSDGESLNILATDLKKTDPPGLPFRGANILFDMAISDSGSAYFAYYGNREVLKVDADGNTSSILSSGDDWSPHGVDEFDGAIYVLESTTPPKAWEVWKDRTLRPRVRVLRPSGKVETLFEYPPD